MVNKKENFKNRKGIKQNKRNPASVKTNIDYAVIKKYRWSVVAVLFFSALFFSNSINNGFVNWDDGEYITDNPYIRDLSFSGIVAIFSNPYFSNYHPFTTLTYALEFNLFGLNPVAFHFTNYILHLLNILLVFILFRGFSKRIEIPVITALLFAVHPMHVESVAWISERKDLLYTFFFLASLIIWTKYIKSEFKISRYYYISLLLFICSLMSKSAAAVLPVIMALFIYFFAGKIHIKDVLRLIPFLILSLLFGIIALVTQKAAISDLTVTYTAVNRFFLVSYAAFFYLFSFIFPFNFSTFHYFPVLKNGLLPAIYYVAPLILLLIIFLVFKLKKDLRNIIVFGLLFFLICLSLIIQVIPVGNAIVSERYTYVPYIGLAYIFAELYVRIYDRYNKNLVKISGLAFIAFLAVSTWLQNYVWKDSISLWSKAIDADPANIIAYNKRGSAKEEVKDFDGAINDFNKAITINPDFKDSYYNRGNVRRETGDFIDAIKDYNKAVELKPDYYEAYNNRGLAKAETGDIPGAIADYDKVLKIKPDHSPAYNNKGLAKVKLGDFKGALSEYDKAIKLNPDYAQAYHNRGFPKFQLGDINGAIADCSKAIKLDPDFAESYNNRAHLRLMSGDKAGACEDWTKAGKLGLKEADAMLDKYCN